MPTPQTEVRTADPEDWPRIAELTATVYLDEGYADAAYAEQLRDVGARMSSASVLVAVLDGQVAGSVTVATRGGSFAEQAGPGEAVVRMLVTDPAARGRGVGTALVQEALDMAQRDGCSRVRLSTQASMQAAHRIYAAVGFTRTPERDWSPAPGVDLLTYELPLTWCGLCGRAGRHAACRTALDLEPPRYCARCRRRMVVQVTPTGWTARCSEHGTITR